MGYRLSEADKKIIEERVKSIEISTQGEIVPCVYSKSDNYPVVAPLVAISFSILYLYSGLYLFEMEHLILFIGFLITLVFGFTLGKLDIFKRLFLHPSVMKDEVHQFFIETFFENKLHYTKDRTGILIGISLLERRVEILCGKGIAEKIDTQVWDNIIQLTIENIKNDNLLDAILTAIDRCGEILIKEFPAKKDNPNEISDKLITDL